MQDNFQKYKILERVREDKIFDKFIAYDSIKKELVFLKICKVPYGKSTRLGEELIRLFKIYSKIIHPNLFKILDFGYSEDKFYVAMEYIKGDYLDRTIHRESIDTDFSLKVIFYIAQGLKALEENYLFHGNLSTSSIFIGERGEVKIDDIGSNRLIFPIVETLSISDDIYQLGTIFQELITYSAKRGRIVYSKEIEGILCKIKHKNPQERYQSVGKLLTDLSLFMKGTLEVKTPDATPEVKIHSGRRYTSRSTDDYHKYERVKPHRISYNRLRVVGVFGIFILLFAWYFYYLFSKPLTEIPNLVGLTVEESKEVVKKRKLNLHITSTRYDPKVKPNTVLEQRPAPHKTVKGGRTVYVVVSLPPQKITVPDLVKKTEKDALSILENAGLKVGKITTLTRDDVEKGVVIGQSPPPFSILHQGDSVDLQISSGPTSPIIEVPDLKGLSFEEGKVKIEQIGLKLGYVKKVVSEEIPEGEIISQIPPPKTRVKLGDIVNLDVSTLLPSKETTSPKKERIEQVAELTITVPRSDTGSPELQPVRVVVIDSEGVREVYNKTHAPGDKIRLNIKGLGKTTVQVYIAGELKQEKTF